MSEPPFAERMESIQKGLDALAVDLDAIRRRPDSFKATRQLDDLMAEELRLQAVFKQLEGLRARLE